MTELLIVFSLVIGLCLGSFIAAFNKLIRWDHVKALHYCDVLNKIIWKLPATWSDKDDLATYATGRLLFDHPQTKYIIYWDQGTEKFLIDTAA